VICVCDAYVMCVCDLCVCACDRCVMFVMCVYDVCEPGPHGLFPLKELYKASI